MSRLPLFKNNDIFSSPFRRLVKESHAIFNTFPRNTSETTKANIISLSRRYRSIVHECVENLTRDLTTDHDEQIETFRQIEVIWSLCEIILLDVSQTGTLIIQLKNWIRMHFEESSKESKEILKSLENNSYRFGEEDVAESYWNLVVKLVLRGELKKAVHLLRSHHEYNQDNQLQLVADMLEQMPVSNQYIAHEFINKWSNWTKRCKQERETGQFDSKPGLLTVVKLLSGDLSVYEEVVPICETWYQLMVSYLLYTDPCIKETDLSELCRRSIAIFKNNHPHHTRSSPEPDRFDEIIISAFEYDLTCVIAHCCVHFNDNWWFVTHFVDLLHCSNHLKIQDIERLDKLRETFLQDYASALFDDDDLWPIGVSYLDKCAENGMLYLETLLSRIPLDINDEFIAHKIISLAKKRGLTGLSKSVCSLMSRAWLSDISRLGDDSMKTDKYKRTNEISLPPTVNLSNALYWAIKSENVPLTTYIADQYLYYYCKTGSFPDTSIFECLKRSTIEIERLAFLTKYYEFKELVQNSDDLSEAGDLIRALLASKIYPKFFCQQLLHDAKTLLEVGPQIIFKPDKTLDLMRSVEEISKQGVVEEDIELHKNLVRNMARALLFGKK